MNQAALQSESSGPSRWHNHLSREIHGSAAFKELQQGLQKTLQAIADHGRLQPDGSYVTFGGVDLILKAGCSESTFWRHIPKLERAGLLTVALKGGRSGSRNVGNVYRIPAKPGAFEGHKCRRDVVRMCKDEEGKLRRVVVEPGDQQRLWVPPREESSPPENSQPPQEWEYPTRKMGVPHSQNGSTPYSQNGCPSYSYGLSSNKNHDHGGHDRGVVTRRDSKRWPPRHLTVEMLKNTTRVGELFYEAVARGMTDTSEDALLYFIACACHALRVGKNPPALFVKLTKMLPQHCCFITNEDDQEAHRRWKVSQEQASRDLP